MFGNLSIRSKLLALLAVPVAAAVLLGVAGVAAAWGDRARAGGERRAAVAAGQAVAAVHQLQEERVRAATFLAGDGQQVRADLRDRRRRVDQALAAYRAAADGLVPTGDPALDQAVAVATERLDRLAVVRVEVDRRVVTAERAMASHDAMVDALLGVTRGLADSLQAPGPARSARLLLAVGAAKEATGQERVVLATTPVQGRAAAPAATAGRASAPGAAPAPGAPTPPSAASAPSAAGSGLRLRLAATAAVARQELNGVRATAGPRLEEVDRALGGAGVRDVRHLELVLLDPAAVPAPVGDPDRWRAGLTARAAALRGLERAVAGDLAESSGTWLARQETGLRDRLVVLAAMVLASLPAMLLVWRGPLGRGPAGPDRSMVPGLARRGQALAARQLQLLGELAADEPDRHRRQGLLGVDHLASRLRRTAETLVAVSGNEPASRWAHPVPLNVVLRAAVAEAEPGGPSGGVPVGNGDPAGPEGSRERRRRATVGRGPRADLLTTGEVQIEGPAGTDLAHLLAELLDNAAAYSPPTAPITVTGAADGDDYLIEVSDRGLGMTDQELAWASQRLADAAAGVGTGAGAPAGAGDEPGVGAGAAAGTSTGTTPLDPARHAAGDRLGLAVTGRLAARNGFGVRLGRSPTGGVTATVRVPARLLSARAPASAARKG